MNTCQPNARRSRWLRLLALLIALALPRFAAGQTLTDTAHVAGITAKDAHSDFEVVFDKPVCKVRTPATHGQVLKARSTNHTILYTALMAAFLSNLPVRVQTSDDGDCHILALQVSR